MHHSALAQEAALNFSPLDMAEEVLIQHDLPYDRPVEEEIVGEAPGIWGTLKLWYRWEEPLNLLVFTCAMENKIPSSQRAKIYPLLAAINEKLWLGHFDLSTEEGVVIFRYSMLTRSQNDISIGQLESLLEIATTECDRFYPALQSVIWGNQPAEEALHMAMFETAGEA